MQQKLGACYFLSNCNQIINTRLIFLHIALRLKTETERKLEMKNQKSNFFSNYNHQYIWTDLMDWSHFLKNSFGLCFINWLWIQIKLLSQFLSTKEMDHKWKKWTISMTINWILPLLLLTSLWLAEYEAVSQAEIRKPCANKYAQCNFRLMTDFHRNRRYWRMISVDRLTKHDSQLAETLYNSYLWREKKEQSFYSVSGLQNHFCDNQLQ